MNKRDLFINVLLIAFAFTIAAAIPLMDLGIEVRRNPLSEASVWGRGFLAHSILVFHGAPGFTGDMDIFVRPDRVNAENTLEALAVFGFKFSNLTLDDFQKPDKVVQLGVPPVRIDLIKTRTLEPVSKSKRERTGPFDLAQGRQSPSLQKTQEMAC